MSDFISLLTFSKQMLRPFNSIPILWIDIDGTLLDFKASSYLALRKTFETHGYSWKESYFSQFEKINHDLWNQIEAQTLDRQGLGKIRFPSLFQVLHLTLLNPRAFEEDFCSFLNQFPVLIPGAYEGLQALQKWHLPLFIITNGTSHGQRERLKNGKMSDAFEKVFVSEDFQVSKPNPIFFQKALQQTRALHPNLQTLTPKEIVVIGDSWSADIQGGLHFGTKAIWFSPQGKTKALQSLERSARQKAKEALSHKRLWIAKDWKEIVEGVQFFQGSLLKE